MPGFVKFYRYGNDTQFQVITALNKGEIWGSDKSLVSTELEFEPNSLNPAPWYNFLLCHAE